MTSFTLSSFEDRENYAKSALLSSHRSIQGCTFCSIIRNEASAFKIYEDEHTLAFLDILPIRRGHTLVVPKLHCARLTDLPDDASANVAAALPRICRAICMVLRQPNFQICLNNGYAQVIDHTHWHVVPAPRISTDNATRNGDFSTPLGLRELSNRYELEDEDAEVLSQAMRAALANEMNKTKLRCTISASASKL